MFYHAGDSRHTQNIQINKVIGENENVSFLLWKKLNGLFGQANISGSSLSRKRTACACLRKQELTSQGQLEAQQVLEGREKRQHLG